jgi:Uma2 family endonuclease
MSASPTSAGTTALLLESPRRLSVEEYHRMAETGILGQDERVELLEGLIVSMSPQHGPHAWAVEQLNRVLVRTLSDEFRVRPQLPLSLGDRNEPEPDLAVVRAVDRNPDQHPNSALLVIEVSGPDSLARDRGVKAPLYARFGIPEYWLVKLESQSVEVLSDPDSSAAAYRRSRTLSLADVLISEVLPGISVPVRDLFS